MQKLCGILFLIAAFCLTLDVTAQDQKKRDPFGNPEENFKKLDKNNDNKLSKEEFLAIAKVAKDADKEAKLAKFLEKAFDKHATGGELTLEKYKDIRKAFQEKKKKKDQ